MSIFLYLSLGISLSSPIFSVSIEVAPEPFCNEVIETLAILSEIFIANRITSCFCCFLNIFFEVVLNTSLPNYLA